MKPGRKTGIYFDEKTLQLLDKFAENKGQSRSAAVRFCVNSYLKAPTRGV